MIALPARVPLKVAAAAIALFLLALLIGDRNRWKSKTEHYAALLSAERSAHGGTVANYRAAAERARREDAENLARVRASQAAINERTRNDFESRIAAARARAANIASGRLRRETDAARADPGGGGAAGLPGVSASPRGASEAAGEDGLSKSDRLIATEQAIQLDELIRWIRAQAEVDANAE